MVPIAPVADRPIFTSEAVAPIQSGSVDDTAAIRALEGEGEASGVEGAGPSASFGSFLSAAVDQANQLDLEASRKVDALASGAADDLHGTMISVKEADISLKLVGTVRNKILDAFSELWRTSV